MMKQREKYTALGLSCEFEGNPCGPSTVSANNLEQSILGLSIECVTLFSIPLATGLTRIRHCDSLAVVTQTPSNWIPGPVLRYSYSPDPSFPPLPACAIYWVAGRV